MKVTDIAAARTELAAKDDLGLAYFDALIAKHTREAPDGLATRLLDAARNLHPGRYCAECGPLESCALMRDATPEACAALDAAPARVANLELANEALVAEVAHYRAVADAAEKRALNLEAELRDESGRGDKLARRMLAEQAIARDREGRETRMLDLLDDAVELLHDLSSLSGLGGQMAARIDAFLREPTAVPESKNPFICFAVQYFVDGELDDEQHVLFRAHLPDCAGCRKALAEITQQNAMIQNELIEHAEKKP